MFNIGDICSADRDFQRRDGGPGSGNWGHVGRPGHRGGSGSGGGAANRLTMQSGGFTSINNAYKENEKWNSNPENQKKLAAAKKENQKTEKPKSAKTLERERRGLDNKTRAWARKQTNNLTKYASVKDRDEETVIAAMDAMPIGARITVNYLCDDPYDPEYGKKDVKTFEKVENGRDYKSLWEEKRTYAYPTVRHRIESQYIFQQDIYSNTKDDVYTLNATGSSFEIPSWVKVDTKKVTDAIELTKARRDRYGHLL